MIFGRLLRLSFGVGIGFYLTYTAKDTTHNSIKKNIV